MADVAALKQYADKHGLALESGRAVTAGSLVRVRAASDHSLSGPLLGSDPSGQSAGFEVAIAPAAEGAANRAESAGAEGVTMQFDGGYVVASRPTAAGVGPSVEGLDAVVGAAASAK